MAACDRLYEFAGRRASRLHRCTSAAGSLLAAVVFLTLTYSLSPATTASFIPPFKIWSPPTSAGPPWPSTSWPCTCAVPPSDLCSPVAQRLPCSSRGRAGRLGQCHRSSSSHRPPTSDADYPGLVSGARRGPLRRLSHIVTDIAARQPVASVWPPISLFSLYARDAAALRTSALSADQ